MKAADLTPETTLTFFQETKELFQETDRKFQETDRKFQDTDRKFQETDRKFQETDRQFSEMKAELRDSFKDLNRIIGNLGNRLGEFVEHMVKPGAVRIFREWGLDVHQVFSDACGERDGESIEVDLVVVNEGSVVAVECKSKLTEADVKQHLDRLEKFKRMFPQWVNHKLHGAVATMVLSDSLAKFAQKNGLFVIAQTGNTVEIRNGEDFAPRAFGD